MLYPIKYLALYPKRSWTVTSFEEESTLCSSTALVDGSYNSKCCGLVGSTWCDQCSCGRQECCESDHRSVELFLYHGGVEVLSGRVLRQGLVYRFVNILGHCAQSGIVGRIANEWRRAHKQAHSTKSYAYAFNRSTCGMIVAFENAHLAIRDALQWARHKASECAEEAVDEATRGAEGLVTHNRDGNLPNDEIIGALARDPLTAPLKENVLMISMFSSDLYFLKTNCLNRGHLIRSKHASSKVTETSHPYQDVGRRLTILLPSWKPLKSPAHRSYDECVEAKFDRNDGNFWDSAGAVRFAAYRGQLDTSSTVIDIGGNRGDDSGILVEDYEPRRVIIFEPISVLCSYLKQRFASRVSRRQVRILCYGLYDGSDNRTIPLQVSGKNMEGSSMLVEAHEASNYFIHVLVRNVVRAFVDLQIVNLRRNMPAVDLLAVNCEGCEYQVIPAILRAGWIMRFKNIQIARHWVPNKVAVYCSVQQELLNTHEIVFNYPWVLESWRLRRLNR